MCIRDSSSGAWCALPAAAAYVPRVGLEGSGPREDQGAKRGEQGANMIVYWCVLTNETLMYLIN